jgi:hypothetical protein
MCPYDYDLFANMKEPLGETHYNTKEEIIHTAGRSLLDINRSGRTDGIQHLPQIWQKAVHVEGNYNEGI